MYGIFDDKDDYIAEKKFFFGKLPFEVKDVYDWNKHMDLLNTHPDNLIDTNSKKFRIEIGRAHV